MSRVGGGKTAKVTYLAQKLGREAVLLWRVGDDDLAEQTLASLRQTPINPDPVPRVEDAETAISVITVPPDGKKGNVLASGANEA
ncbi:PfkB family carbohydrate kinase [Palleronia sp.]|uniref:PfkB family carbohydrate kinase n=1 Tax=Palleronia sp. TaxID=1940284 RepID=UPI0035C84F41